MLFKDVTIGIPREIMPGEQRVAATPETVRTLVSEGARVLVEQDAGAGAYIQDADYRTAGADVASGPEELFQAADLVLKVKEPIRNQALERHETDLMHAGQVLVTFLHPANPANHAMVRDLAARGVTALSLDGIPRISSEKSMDALTAMSTIAGYKAVLSAAALLPKFFPMVATGVGMIQPAKVLVVGTGVAGLQALATAKRLGAVTYAADVRPEAMEQAQSLGAKPVDTGIAAADAVGPGGYARALPAALLEQERAALAPVLADTDVVILSALVPGRRAPLLVTASMVRSMPKGAVIADISIDQGGNCELTPAGKREVHDGITIDGTKNIPGSVPVTATQLFSRNVLHFIRLLSRDGRLAVDLEDEILKAALVTHEGRVVHEGTLEAMADLEGKGSV